MYLLKSGRHFGLYTDASKTGLGARLYQFDENNPEVKYTIAYASRSLKPTEKNYTITELKCLALVFALHKWHTILLGRKIRIHTDHKALKFVSLCVNTSERIARWLSFIQEFDLEIIHVPGKNNEIADTLSRNTLGTYQNRNELTFKVCFILNHEDGTNTDECINMLQESQSTDTELQQKLQQNTHNYKKTGRIDTNRRRN